MTKIDQCSSVTEISNTITILQAIRWTSEAWKTVESTTIQKCFRKAGILDQDFNVVRSADIGEDTFRDLDVQLEEDNNDPELVNLM